jgi:hypothetical protein
MLGNLYLDIGTVGYGFHPRDIIAAEQSGALLELFQP